MYNRYIGNTGRYVRVEDNQRQIPYPRRQGFTGPGPNQRGPSGGPVRNGPPPVHQPPATAPPKATGPGGPRPSPQFNPLGGFKSLLGGGGGGSGGLLGGGLKGLLGGGGTGGLLGGGGGGGLKGLLGGGSGGLKGIFEHLPFGLDIGDLLLLGLLLLFFVDSQDEEFLIILAIFAYSIYKDSRGPLDSKGVLQDAF